MASMALPCFSHRMWRTLTEFAVFNLLSALSLEEPSVAIEVLSVRALSPYAMLPFLAFGGMDGVGQSGLKRSKTG